MALAVDYGLQDLAGVLGPLQGVHGGHIRGLRGSGSLHWSSSRHLESGPRVP